MTALAGADGNDTLNGGAGNDALTGDGGDDSLVGMDGNDALAGGEGNDSLHGEIGDDSVTGEAGDDTLTGSFGADVLDGGAGQRHPQRRRRRRPASRRRENDVLDARLVADDYLEGGAGDDRLRAAGADTLAGSEGDDQLLGDSGNDRLSGGDGADGLYGGLDDDVLAGGLGADVLAGEDGWDTADYTGRSEALTIDLDDQADDGAPGEGDNVTATSEVVIAGSGNDRLTGNASENYLYGEGGNDRIDGAGAADRLFGGAGRDTLTGGRGADSLDGGEGADKLLARDRSREAVRCGGGRDTAETDIVDMLFGCEKRPSKSHNWTTTDRSAAKRVSGARARTSGGRFVAIPGAPGHTIDRRLLADVAYLQRKYKIAIVAGYELHGHAKKGEHPIGLALDIVPGPGGSWSDIDRLAKWAEPRQNRPRAPFRWVGYNGDKNHGRGNHLHLSWNHTPAKRGRPAGTVWTFAF